MKSPIRPITTNDVALLFAARDGATGLVLELLTAGADVNTVNGHGNTPLIMAAQHGSPATIALLLNPAVVVDAANGIGNTALLYAAYNGRTDAVELLIAAGADVNARNHRGNTPLIYGAYGGHLAVVDRLLSAHAVIDQGDEDARTALMWAVIRGQVAVTQRLLAGGAAVGAVDVLGNTALDWARVMRRTETGGGAGTVGVTRRVRAGMPTGMDVAMRESRSRSPMRRSRAAWYGHTCIDSAELRRMRRAELHCASRVSCPHADHSSSYHRKASAIVAHDDSTDPHACTFLPREYA